MFENIKILTQTFGPSGREGKISDTIRGLMEGHVDEILSDAMGNLICVKKGSGKKIMLAAHMDEIGVIVTYIDEKGFLRFGNIGGLPPFIILGQRVRFESGVTGVIWYEEDIDNIKNVNLGKMYIDIGAVSREEAEKLVRVGDMAVFTADTIKQDGKIISKALDDRIGCAILIELAKQNPDTDYIMCSLLRKKWDCAEPGLQLLVSCRIWLWQWMCATLEIHPGVSPWL